VRPCADVPVTTGALDLPATGVGGPRAAVQDRCLPGTGRVSAKSTQKARGKSKSFHNCLIFSDVLLFWALLPPDRQRLRPASAEAQGRDRPGACGRRPAEGSAAPRLRLGRLGKVGSGDVTTWWWPEFNDASGQSGRPSGPAVGQVRPRPATRAAKNPPLASPRCRPSPRGRQTAGWSQSRDLRPNHSVTVASGMREQERRQRQVPAPGSCWGGSGRGSKR
jgi:hypothetical protein